MNLVFEFPLTEKQKVVAIVEADPYGKPSFSRNGYKLRDGVTLSQDKEKGFLYVKCADEFVAFAREKLAGIAVPSDPKVTAAIAGVIEGEESNSQMGFGSIFGSD